MSEYNPDLSKNLIVQLTFDFALEVVKYAELLELSRHYVIGNQLLKSGTSIGANVREAQNAESRPDFIHKFKISAKEADETEYWLLLCKYSKDYPECEQLLQKIDQIKKVLSKIIATSKKHQRINESSN